MFDPKKLLGDFLGSKVPGMQGSVGSKAGDLTQLARNNPLATGAIAAVLLGTKTGRSLGGSALKLGGLAAVAGLAYKAYQHYQAGERPQTQPNPAQAEPELLPPPADTSFHPSMAPQGEDEFALSLVRVMIAAANADGHIDDAERVHIMGKLDASGVDAEDKQFIDAEIAKPLDIHQLAAQAQTDAQKVEIYTAARLTIDPDARAERRFLDELATALNLPDALTDHVDTAVKEQQEIAV
ncbi:tellurite resistance TerB family protein [Limoniibacter endophyticus]|uniref:Protein YebE n=1 Tax=Limoniibacter endophyticus TaxID=1565040 RepID=A0A8J3GFQ7_9HYPH|nr:tellurite resistance TerB family protein [Limoniibacter endophyticus]GHC64365.1 protein YebE [Limoniibacter endophyticus]